MTSREIFETVRNHLLMQNTKAMNEYEEMCSYHTDGLQCAVGCLINDLCYDREIEGSVISIGGEVAEAVECSLGHNLTNDDVVMLRLLQRVHDDLPVVQWRLALWTIEQKLDHLPPIGDIESNTIYNLVHSYL